MSLVGWLNTPGWRGRTWRFLYEIGYLCLKGAVLMALCPWMRVRYVGPRPKLPEGGLIICPNHASYLDPAFVQIVLQRRVTFVMTDDFYRLIWGRWFYNLVGAISVGSGRHARKGLRRAIALARRGHAVCVFPEGGLTRDGHINRGFRGISVMARRSGAPILPIGIAGNFRAWGHGAKRPRLARVRLHAGPLLRWEGPRDRAKERAFVDEIMERIQAAQTWIETNTPDKWDNWGRVPKDDPKTD